VGRGGWEGEGEGEGGGGEEGGGGGGRGGEGRGGGGGERGGLKPPSFWGSSYLIVFLYVFFWVGGRISKFLLFCT